MPHPVSMITNAGKTFLFGLPSLFLASHIPSSPAHHHTIPILVCCRSLATHGPPHLCSVKVLTQPHAAIMRLSKNSWLRPVRLSQSWPTKSKIVRRMP